MPRDTEFFTIVFRGDITKLSFNPMTARTEFGEVVASGMGNAFVDSDVVGEISDFLDDLEKRVSEFRDQGNW